MGKLGKYSTGLRSPKTSESPYGQSNKGWDIRSNMMAVMKSMESRQKPRKSSNGAAPDIKKG